MAHQAHAYHIVDPSPWPLTGAIAALLITSGLAIWFHFQSTILLTLGLTLLLLTTYQWWRDIVRESTFQGHHTPPVQKGLRYGMILFISSEIFFFAGFFWAFYHMCFSPDSGLGGHWPPSGITSLNPFEVPLLNTAVLLASGVTVTWAHHSIIEKIRKQTIQALTLTILLGFYFHISSRLRILWSPLYNRRWGIWCHLFCRHWFPRPSRHYWLYLLNCLSYSSNSLSFYISTSLRIRSSNMILTLRRCRLTIPLYLHLLMRLLIFLVSITV